MDLLRLLSMLEEKTKEKLQSGDTAARLLLYEYKYEARFLKTEVAMCVHSQASRFSRCSSNDSFAWRLRLFVLYLFWLLFLFHVCPFFFIFLFAFPSQLACIFFFLRPCASPRIPVTTA